MKTKSFQIFSSISFFISAFTICLSSSSANDSIASVATGGLVLLKTNDIRMVREDLTISTDNVKVHYKFRNETNNTIQATVAFPMPPYGWNSGEFAGMANERPLDNFAVKVDGKSIVTKSNKRAQINNRDITAALRGVGLNDDQIFKTFAYCADDTTMEENYCGISKAQEDKLKKIGSWKVAEAALWEQSFPAHESIDVGHQYSPFVGHSYIYAYQQNELNYSELEQLNDACLDSTTYDALKNRVQKLVSLGSKSVRIRVAKIEYILGTGRNWKGPIQHFNLRIVKDAPKQILSLCFPGKPKRINPITFEFKQKNYTPQDSIIIYFFDVES